MEASQASEAGSIPVARSTPRPAARRAVLLCPLRAYNGDWRRHQHPREPRAHTNGCGTVQRGIARHKGPTRGRHSAQGLRGVPPPLPAWRAPRRLQNMGAVPVGLKYLAQHSPNTGTSTKKLAQHKASGRISVQNSPSKRSSPVEWCNRFVSFGLGYALSWSGVSSCWVGCGVSRDLVRMSRLR